MASTPAKRPYFPPLLHTPGEDSRPSFMPQNYSEFRAYFRGIRGSDDEEEDTPPSFLPSPDLSRLFDDDDSEEEILRDASQQPKPVVTKRVTDRKVSPEEALIELHKWRMNRQLPREDLWDPCAVFPDPVRVEKKRYREEFYHAAEDHDSLFARETLTAAGKFTGIVLSGIRGFRAAHERRFSLLCKLLKSELDFVLNPNKDEQRVKNAEDIGPYPFISFVRTVKKLLKVKAYVSQMECPMSVVFTVVGNPAFLDASKWRVDSPDDSSDEMEDAENAPPVQEPDSDYDVDWS